MPFKLASEELLAMAFTYRFPTMAVALQVLLLLVFAPSAEAERVMTCQS
jgi:hypothetical protein